MDVIDVGYYEVVEKIPSGRREELSDKLVDVILASKNEKKMSAKLANSILYHWQRGLLEDDEGLGALLESAAILEPEKTLEILEDLRLMEIVEKVKVYLKV